MWQRINPVSHLKPPLEFITPERAWVGGGGWGVLTLYLLQFSFSHQNNSHYIIETGPSEIFKASSGGSLARLQPLPPPPPSPGTASAGRATCAKCDDESIMHEQPTAASHTLEELIGRRRAGNEQTNVKKDHLALRPSGCFFLPELPAWLPRGPAPSTHMRRSAVHTLLDGSMWFYLS